MIDYRQQSGVEGRILTVLLVVGVEVIDDLAHTVDGEVLRVESENPSLVHVI